MLYQTRQVDRFSRAPVLTQIQISAVRDKHSLDPGSYFGSKRRRRISYHAYRIKFAFSTCIQRECISSRHHKEVTIPQPPETSDRYFLSTPHSFHFPFYPSKLLRPIDARAWLWHWNSDSRAQPPSPGIRANALTVLTRRCDPQLAGGLKTKP